MSMSSSLNAGVMGLNVNATRLAAISNNVSNASTFGYKRTEANFASMVLQQRRNAYAAGGVRVDTTKLVDTRGSLISTGRSTDIAVAGRGLLPVTTPGGVNEGGENRSLLLTPTGDFAPDQDGFLRTSGGLHLLGWPTDASGDPGAISRRSGESLQPVNINVAQFSAQPTTRIELGVNLPATATEAGGLGDPFVLPLEYYDNLGKLQELTAEFTPDVSGTGASNSWTVTLTDEAQIPPAQVGTLNVTFNDTPEAGGTLATVTPGNGATYDPATGEAQLNLSSGPVSIFVGKEGRNEGLTQLSASFSPYAVAKNGAPVGDLSTVEIDGFGRLQAIYDNGFRRTIFQIPVADVPNLNGLNPTDNQAYTVSQESGDLYLWDAGEGPVGETVGYALMESTTDIGTEMTDLIKTQRAYTSNAKIIQTVDEMLQETTNIIR
ncbi:flagellar hook protein FlgE [Parvularcula oceani]|uniref:flagellar hook protein FlgE n=1 Tax=Parvularcula oceani TaxID=1247963 RepID=UPI0004E164F4|nr:flagellar hook-basal body complex protein [Parvularcula oceani]